MYHVELSVNVEAIKLQRSHTDPGAAIVCACIRATKSNCAVHASISQSRFRTILL